MKLRPQNWTCTKQPNTISIKTKPWFGWSVKCATSKWNSPTLWTLKHSQGSNENIPLAFWHSHYYRYYHYTKGSNGSSFRKYVVVVKEMLRPHMGIFLVRVCTFSFLQYFHTVHLAHKYLCYLQYNTIKEVICIPSYRDLSLIRYNYLFWNEQKKQTVIHTENSH